MKTVNIFIELPDKEIKECTNCRFCISVRTDKKIGPWFIKKCILFEEELKKINDNFVRRMKKCLEAVK
jgi:hypothetical protein